MIPQMILNNVMHRPIRTIITVIALVMIDFDASSARRSHDAGASRRSAATRSRYFPILLETVHR